MSLFNSSSSRLTRCLAENYYSYLIYLYALLLPQPNKLKSGALILLALVWLATIKKSAPYLKDIIRNKVFLSFLLLYFLYLLSFFFSQHKKEAADFLILQISVPLLPLLFYKQLTKEQVRRAVLVFSISILSMSLLALYKTYTVYFNAFPLTTNNLKSLDWAYFSFTLPISVDFHAPYFSLYMCIGLVVILSEIRKAAPQRNRTALIIYTLLAVYFFIFIALLSSRTALFATVAVVTAIAAVYLLQQRKVWITIVLFLTVAAGTFTAYQDVPYLHEKTSSFSGHDERASMWRAAMAIIKENPVFGVGIGDDVAAQLAQYRLLGFENGITEKYNAHNQYLDITVSLGFLGLIFFLFSIAAVFQYAVKARNPVLLAFILIFALCCITESLMHRQLGVVLFSFFCAIFVFAKKPPLAE